MNRWSSLIEARPRTVLALGLIVIVLAGIYGGGVFDRLSNGGFDDPSSESAQAAKLQQAAFGRHEADVVAVYSSKDKMAADGAFRSQVEAVIRELPDDAVERTTTWYDTKSPELLSTDGHATAVMITLDGQSQDALATDYDKIKDNLDADGLTTNVAGEWAVFGDVNEIVSGDIARAESLSMPLVLILSLLIFGSVVAALMPVGVGIVAIVGALATVRLLTTFTEVSVFAINVITLLGLGLAIDYALFIISRFREELAARPSDGREGVAESIRATLQTAGRTVLFSGLTVAAALASLLVFPQTFLRSMAYGGMAAVLVAMITALTLLPAALIVLGRRIDKGAMPWRRRSLGQGDAHGRWARFARQVMKRPVVSIVAVVAILAMVGAPFLGVSWGSVDHRALPADAPSRVAADVLADNFGGEQSSAQIMLSGASPSGLRDFESSAKAVEGVTGITVVDQGTHDGEPTTLLRATWDGNSQAEKSQRIVDDLRGIDVPDGQSLVGGTSAEVVDLLSSVADRLPVMGIVVVAVMLVLLFLAFGSIVLPIKAVLVNVVSLTASFGVVAWIFAGGRFEGLLGFTSTGYLDATQPILMLAILFGLSMDYEVFLLSRVREHWDATGDNTAAVATGVQQTGRIITSAALLLAVVTGAFATSGIVFIKMIGVGMLVALFIAATIVRLVLVPATMRLLGPLNWWAPGPMRRWWERHGLREGAKPESEPADHDAERERILAR